MPASAQDERRWLDPKWFVVAAALAVFGLIVSYDVRLGMAAGALLGAGVFVWLYLALRYASPKGGESGRSLLVERVRQQTSNRRAATDRIAAPASLSSQQSPDPAKRP